ncbi:MAG: HAD family hydrolase [Nitrospirae bacterium]|nr:HAD family hydrolase [Nitrospirota bacterium]
MTNNILCTDMDGPIINCEDRYYTVYRDSVREFGGVPLSKEVFWEQKRSCASEKHLLLQSGLGEDCYSRFIQLKLSKIEEDRYLLMDFLQPDIHRMLTSFKDIFCKIFLITLRRNEKALKAQLTRLNIGKYFDRVLSGYHEGVPGWKIKTALYKQESVIDFTCASGYFIGDTEDDILAGKEIGLKTIAVSSGIRTKEILQSYDPDYIIEHLRDAENLFCHTGHNKSRD